MPELTKAIIMGTKHRSPVTLKSPNGTEEYTVYVRPLSSGEAEIIHALNAAGMKMKGNPRSSGLVIPGGAGPASKQMDMTVEADVEEMTRNQLKAKQKAVSVALCMEESWSEKEIAQHWPAAWVDEVAKVVYRISGIETDKSEVRQFRTLPGGAGVAAADPARDPAGEQSD